jgi:hypothetical protein
MANLKFEEATRETFNNGTLAGWIVKASGISKNHYKTLVLAEG